MAKEEWHSGSAKGFLMQHRYIYINMCESSPPATAVRFLFFPWTYSRTHRLTLQNRAGLALHTNQPGGQLEWEITRGKGGRKVERDTEAHQGGGRGEEKNKKGDCVRLWLSPWFHLCSQSWASYKGILLPRRPPWGRGGGVCALDGWQSGGAPAPCSNLMITLLTAAKNGRHRNWSSGSVSDLKGLAQSTIIPA